MNVPLPVLTLQRPRSNTGADSWATVLHVSKSEPAFTTKLLFTKVTWSVALQPFWTTVHVNTLFPPLRLLTELVARVPVPTTGPPLTLHVPTPWPGVLAARLPVLLQTVWSVPALADTASLRTSVVLLLLQIPLVTVHWKRLSPMDRFVTPVVATAGSEMLDPPVTTLHRPVPWLGEAAFRLALLLHVDTVEPAFETTLLFITKRSVLTVHALLLTVQVNVLLPWPRPVTFVLATLAWAIAAGLSVLQLPRPTIGTVAPSWALLLQTSKLEETTAADGLSFTISTRSMALQPFFVPVHWNVLRPS